MSKKSDRHPVSNGEARRIKASIESLKERLKPNLPPGVMEAPENIPENSNGKLKIISE